jgi:hypothetical protein
MCIWYVNAYVNVSASMCMCNICLCVCVHACMYAWVHVCMRVYVSSSYEYFRTFYICMYVCWNICVCSLCVFACGIARVHVCAVDLPARACPARECNHDHMRTACHNNHVYASVINNGCVCQPFFSFVCER